MIRWPRKSSDQKIKRRLRRSRSRGLIDRDVFRPTPASSEHDGSRLASRRGDRGEGEFASWTLWGGWRGGSQLLPETKSRLSM